MESTVCKTNFKWRWRIFSQNSNLPFADCDMGLFKPATDSEDRTFDLTLYWNKKEGVHDKQKYKCSKVRFDDNGWIDYDFEYKEASGAKWKIHCHGQIYSPVGSFRGTYSYEKAYDGTITTGEVKFGYTIPNRGMDLDNEYFSD